MKCIILLQLCTEQGKALKKPSLETEWSWQLLTTCDKYLSSVVLEGHDGITFINILNIYYTMLWWWNKYNQSQQFSIFKKISLCSKVFIFSLTIHRIGRANVLTQVSMCCRPSKMVKFLWASWYLQNNWRKWDKTNFSVII
jgi:hypothetical protein